MMTDNIKKVLKGLSVSGFIQKIWENLQTIQIRKWFQGSSPGRSLPAALITLAVGSILLTPFLAFVSSRSLGTGSARETFNEQYAADAGIEFGIWSLLNRPAFRSQVDANVGIPQALSFPGSLNGYTPSITVTGLPLGLWFVRQSAPWTVERGGALAYGGGDRLYATRGDSSLAFGYYSISTNQWFSLANTPQTVQRGGTLVYGGGNYLYALRGRNSEAFWRYNITTNNWASMQPTPDKVREGGALTYNGGNFLYALRGNTNDYWRYNITNNSWAVMANTPANVDYGADLVTVNANTIYAYRGDNTNTFWRYDAASNSWTTRQNTPGIVTDGGALAYHSGNYIYGLQGGTTGFWRYDLTSNTWKILASTPAIVGWGGDISFTHSEGGFVQRGNNFSDFWEFKVTPPRYDISSQAGNVTTDSRIELDGSSKEILFWDID